MNNTHSKGNKSQWLKIGLFLVLMAFVSLGCSDDDGSGSPTTPAATSITPNPGAWAGQDISFTVSEDSASISNFSVTYSGHADGTRCSFDYTTTLNIPTSFSTSDGAFSLTSSTETITGTFTDPNTATVEVTWSRYNAQCDATASGSRTYTATHQ